MSVVSSVGLSRRAMLVMGGIFVLTLLTIIGTLMAVQEPSLVIVLSVLAPTVAAFVLVFALRTEIAIDTHTIRLRMLPIYTKHLAAQDILSVQPAAFTGSLEGFGYRVLGKDRRGLLVGGPSIEITTSERTWIVSCHHPDQIVKTLQTALQNAQQE